jgi:hypothetical protein
LRTSDSGTDHLHELINTAEAATACGVGSSTISNWAAKGYLTRSGLDEANRPLYKLGDVLVASRDTRRRAIGHRRIA